MTMPRRPRRLILSTCGAVALIGTVACGGTSGTSDGPADRGTSTPAPAAAAADAGEAATSLELTDARLDALARGLRREIDAVRASHERSRTATSPQARGEAMQASFEDATMVHGADAAGLPLDEYRRVRQVVTDTLRTLDFQGRIDGPLSMDLSRADAATKERLSRDPLAGLPPASADALRAHMDRLVPIWAEYMRLTAVAG
jgi:hypothetical protein